MSGESGSNYGGESGRGSDNGKGSRLHGESGDGGESGRVIGRGGSDSRKSSGGESGSGGGESGGSHRRPSAPGRRGRRLTGGTLDQLHTNQRLLAAELLRRGAAIRIVDLASERLLVGHDGIEEYLFDRTNGRVPTDLVRITADKCAVKERLAAGGVSVPEGGVFDRTRTLAALDYADSLGYPVVFKPNWGSHGDDVRTDLGSRDQVRAAIGLLTPAGTPFLVERQCVGREYRVFFTARGKYAVLEREPAFVVGNGWSPIRDLAAAESDLRRQCRSKLLCPLVIDGIVVQYLQLSGRTPDSVPARGERVRLRGASNIAKGGVGRDVTDETHPSVIRLARKVLRIFDGLPVIGLDLMTEDISRRLTAGKYGVLEVNSNPGLSMHMMPAEGRPRDVAGYLADVLFPDLPRRG